RLGRRRLCRFGLRSRGGGFALALFLGRAGGGLLGGQLACGFLLGGLLLALARGLHFGLALGFPLAAGLFRGGAGRDLLAPVGDCLPQARQRRRVRLGLLHQREQPFGFVEVLAADALLGGDQGVGHQVGQRTDHRRVGRLLVAQRQVILHGVVACRGVQPLLSQRRAGGLAQGVGVHRRDLGGDGLGRFGSGRGGGRVGRGGGGILGRILLAGSQCAQQREHGGGT